MRCNSVGCCFFKKLQSNLTVIIAAGEEDFGGNRARELSSHQRPNRAELQPSFEPGVWRGCVPVLFMPCLAFLYEKSLATALLY